MATPLAEQINPTLVMSFVKSVKNVLTTMVGLNPQLGKPQLSSQPHPRYDVSGIVGFSGQVVGSVVVSFSKETAINVVETFVGDRIEVDDDDFADAVGELCNMIAGNAKKEFGLDASIGIPSVVIGPGHTVARMRDVPCVLIPCTCEAGEFAVEVNIKEVG